MNSSYQASHFFTAESAKLSSILDLVLAESASSDNAQARIRCQELTAIVGELLGQAQYYSSLAPEDFKGRWLEVQLFAGRSQAVKDAVAVMEFGCTSAAPSPSCKKRQRSGTNLGTESSSGLKRSRSYLSAEEMQADVLMNDLPIRTAAPQSWQMDTRD